MTPDPDDLRRAKAINDLADKFGFAFTADEAQEVAHAIRASDKAAGMALVPRVATVSKLVEELDHQAEQWKRIYGPNDPTASILRRAAAALRAQEEAMKPVITTILRDGTDAIITPPEPCHDP